MNTNQLNLIEHDCPEDNEIDNIDFGYELYSEQKKVLYLMKKLETQKSIIHLDENGSENELYYNKLVLGAPFSFGKSIISLALIKSKNKPIEREQYSFFNNENFSTLQKQEILELYIKRKKRIDTTLVIVSPSTFYQWLEHVKKCKLKVLPICTHDELDILIVNILNNTLSNYDLVLISYKKLRTTYPTPYGKSSLSWSESTNISLISILSMDKLWKRIIIDDFDSINIYNDLSIPTNILWLVSTTNNFISISKNIYHTHNCFDISAINHRIMDVVRDPYIMKLTIKSKLDIFIPKIQLICYTFEYCRTINQILNNLNYPTNVCELINSGDITNAASELGISHSCSSLGEFLYLLIHKNKQSYVKSIKICTLIEEFLTVVNEDYERIVRPDVRLAEELVLDQYKSPMNLLDEIDNDEEYDKWENYKEEIRNNNEFITTNEFLHINTLIKKYKENAGNFKNILERIKRNMEDGLCGNCYCEPEDDRFILQCCNLLLCKYCMLKNDSNIFIDRCPGCTKKIDKNNFIHMPNSISLDQFIDINYEDAFNKLRNFNSNNLNIDDGEDEDLIPKEKAIISIVNGEVPHGCSIYTRDGLSMKNIIESDNIINKTKSINNKYIIFTRWYKTTKRIKDILQKYKFDSIILKGGNSKNIKRDIEKFRNSNINILLLPSQDICAGLNLEFATHIIFYHSIRNSHMTAQLVGRAQRIGRKCSLKLIALENSQEISMFNTT